VAKQTGTGAKLKVQNFQYFPLKFRLKSTETCEQIYEEASKSLARTIKTPLGALSEEQIKKGYEN